MKETKDLLDSSNYNFISYAAFITKYKIRTNYLEYYKVLSALKHFKQKCSPEQNIPPLKSPADNLLSSKNVCKLIYQSIVKRKATMPMKSQGKWLSEDIISNVQVNWENTYKLPFLCTVETKLRVFQFKFIHRRIATNDFLHKIGKKESDSCSFCVDDTETLTHLFWNCKFSQIFWKNISQWIIENLDLTNFSFSPALCLDLVDRISNLLLHHFLLIARHYIYSCK